MSDFVIWPTESLLLGLCVGEYESCDDSVLFSTIVFRRLRPFFPWFPWRANEKEEISTDDLPADIRWVDLTRGERFGLSASSPDWCFWRGLDGELFRRQTLPPERRSFVDLILDAVGPYMAFRSADFVEWKGSPRQHAQMLFSFYDQAFRKGTAMSDIMVGQEFRATIIRTLEQLAEESGDRLLYQAGKLFGRLLAEIEGIAEYVLHCFVTEPGSEPVEVEALVADGIGARTIEELLNVEIVRQNHYADAALCYLRSVDGPFRDPESHVNLPTKLDLDGVHTARSYFWVALGEILGVLRVPDQAFWSRDAASVAPRSMWFEKDSADRIRQRLDIAIRDLSEHADQAGRPEAAVSATYQAIEGLCKRLWPEAFPLSSARLPAVLAAKLTSQNELERRFAGIARNLYLTYRNCASHDPDTFSCSVAEATFFVSGIRTLVDLWERLQKVSPPDSGRK